MPDLLLSKEWHKWPCVNVDSQISAILGGLEDYILRKKRRIYESLSTSVQNDLKPCYEGGVSGGHPVHSPWGLSASLASFSSAFPSRHLSSCILSPSQTLTPQIENQVIARVWGEVIRESFFYLCVSGTFCPPFCMNSSCFSPCCISAN